MKANRTTLAAAVGVGMAAALVVGLSTPAAAYTYEGPKWTLRSNAEIGFVSANSESSTAAHTWDPTDITMVSDSSSPLKLTIRNDGAAGYEGRTTYNYIGGTFTSSTSWINTYYTNGYTVARRKAVWVHEFGHSLGLNHSQFANAIMNPSASDAYLTYGTNVPVSDDQQGINNLY